MCFFAVCAEDKDGMEKNFLSVLNDFYRDLTGTAIIDVLRDVLKKYFEKLDYVKKNNFFVSDAVGFGFFGMDYKENFKIFKLLDCDKIGLYINENGVIYPNKSFIGFFIISEKEFSVGNDCKNCIGSKEGCFFCRQK